MVPAGLTTDQRGEPATVNNTLDIGAYQTQQATTTTTVLASPTASVSGQSMTFTANVVPVSGSALPIGAVQFEVDGSEVGSAIMLGDSATATLILNTLAVGSHIVSAIYTSDSAIDFASGKQLDHR